MKETIVAAACTHKGQVYSLHRPARHGDIFKKFNICFGPDEQGFLTSVGRFVNRIEALYVAKRAGQIVKGHWPPYLYSEDLW